MRFSLSNIKRACLLVVLCADNSFSIKEQYDKHITDAVRLFKYLGSARKNMVVITYPKYEYE